MNIIIISLLLLNIIHYVSCININKNNSLRKITFKLIILKKKTLPKLVDKIKDYCTNCYNKSLVSISEGIHEYNKLTEEEKLILDFVISSIL